MPTQLEQALSQQPVIKEHDDNEIVLTNEEVIRRQQGQGSSSNGELQSSQSVQVQEQPVNTDAQQQEVVTRLLSAEEDTQLDQLLQAKFGVTLKQASEFNEQRNGNPEEFTHLSEVNGLAKDWNVTPEEVVNRIKTISEKYQSLIQSNPNLDSVDGVKQMWAMHEINNPVQATQPDRQSSLLSTVPNKPAYRFTQSQIDGMPEKERRKRYSEILSAYAENLVVNDL